MSAAKQLGSARKLLYVAGIFPRGCHPYVQHKPLNWKCSLIKEVDLSKDCSYIPADLALHELSNGMCAYSPFGQDENMH